MAQLRDKYGKLLVIVLILLAGAVAGFLIGRTTIATNNSTGDKILDPITPTASTKAADLRVNLVTLGVQHQHLAAKTAAATLAGAPETEAYSRALQANGNEIGAVIGAYYGKQGEATFDSVWKVHIDELSNYAAASAKGDQDARQAALKSLNDNFVAPLSQYLSKASPELSENDLRGSLSEHVRLTAQVIDARQSGNYADEVAAQKRADQHMQVVFSSLAGAIVKQFPDKFKD